MPQSYIDKQMANKKVVQSLKRPGSAVGAHHCECMHGATALSI